MGERLRWQFDFRSVGPARSAGAGLPDQTGAPDRSERGKMKALAVTNLTRSAIAPKLRGLTAAAVLETRRLMLQRLGKSE